MRFELPSDLKTFLEKKRKLSFDHAAVPTGRVSLFNIEELRIGRAYSAARSKTDPNYGRDGVYRIPAISLLKSCQRFDPEYLLCFLPFDGKYASMDADHASVVVFRKATCSDISSSPAQYLTALWEKKPRIPVSRSTRWWEAYCFYEDCFE